MDIGRLGPAAEHLVDGENRDGLAAAGLPMLDVGGVEFLIKLARRIVGHLSSVVSRSSIPAGTAATC